MLKFCKNCILILRKSSAVFKNIIVMAELDYYSILGCQEHDSLDIIKRCYHEKARKFHPDKGASVVNSSISFDLISKAWKTLSDPDSRRIYNAKLIEQRFSNQGLVFGSCFISELTFDNSNNTYYKTCRCGGRFFIESDQATLCDNCDISIECDSCSFVLCIKSS